MSGRCRMYSFSVITLRGLVPSVSSRELTYDLPMRRQYMEGWTRSRTCLLDPGCQSLSSSGTDSKTEIPSKRDVLSASGINDRDSYTFGTAVACNITRVLQLLSH